MSKARRVLSPIMIHFLIIQIIVTAGAYLISPQGEKRISDAYYNQVVFMNGIGNLLVAFVLSFWYRKDEEKRKWCHTAAIKIRKRITVLDFVLLLFMGGGLALFSNFILSFFADWIHADQYSQNMMLIMNGKALLFLILFVGMIGPLAEEIVFRWLVYLRLKEFMSMKYAVLVSSFLFGIYHGNMAQFIYAWFLGAFFAILTEWTGSVWSAVFLHAGANILALLMTDYGGGILQRMTAAQMLSLLGICIMVFWIGIFYYYSGYTRRKMHNKEMGEEFDTIR